MAEAVSGLARLERQLRALPDAYLEELKEDLGEGAEALVGHIRAAAPKHTGQMAAGIHAESGAGSGIRGGDVAQARAALGLVWRIICGAPGRWVEYGTKAHPAGDYHDDKGHLRHANRGHHATRREPFFWPTVRAWKKTVGSRFKRSAGKAAKRIAAVR